MEPYFATLFEDNRNERSLMLLLSLTGPDILKQCKSTLDEINVSRDLAPEKL